MKKKIDTTVYYEITETERHLINTLTPLHPIREGFNLSANDYKELKQFFVGVKKLESKLCKK